MSWRFPFIQAGADHRELQMTGTVELVAAAAGEGEPAKLPTVKMVAYNGGLMRLGGWDRPVVVDLKGVRVRAKSRPIFRDHNAGQIVGHTSSIVIGENSITVEGVASGASLAAQEVVATAGNGFPWQASIGASPDTVRPLDAGKQAIVNGQTITGPAYIVRASTLKEISVVGLGADDTTSTTIAASDAGDDLDTPNSESQETDPMSDPKIDKGVEANSPAPAIVTDPTADIRAKAAAEVERIGKIQAIAGIPADVAAAAIKDGRDPRDVELEVLRASRPTAPNANTGRGTEGVSTPDMLVAACMLSGGMSDPSKHGIDVKTVEIAAKRYGKSIGLKQLLVEAAQANGYHGDPYLSTSGAIREALQAGFSTHAISDILSNTANKFLLEGFMGVEQSWNRIASTRNKRDFKTQTSYRLTGAMQYEEVGPDGQLKHAELGDETYTDSLKTYGIMTAITRTDIINDDLGALTAVPRKIGRGGALKLNSVFWTKFLADTSVFNTDNSKGNYLANASSALSSAGLKLATTQFARKTDPDGKPLALRPAILLVPPDLEVTAYELMNATQITGSSTAGQPNVNPWSGRYQIVSSVYLTATKVWYLLTTPSDLDLITVSFLNGQQQPTVETADVDFNSLGIQMRGYHDFGVDWVEYRAGLKVKGEA